MDLIMIHECPRSMARDRDAEQLHGLGVMLQTGSATLHSSGFSEEQ